MCRCLVYSLHTYTNMNINKYPSVYKACSSVQNLYRNSTTRVKMRTTRARALMNILVHLVWRFFTLTISKMALALINRVSLNSKNSNKFHFERSRAHTKRHKHSCSVQEKLLTFRLRAEFTPSNIAGKLNNVDENSKVKSFVCKYLNTFYTSAHEYPNERRTNASNANYLIYDVCEYVAF